MQLSPDGSILYVAASDAGRIEAWDIRTRRLVRVLIRAATRSGSRSSPDGRTLYIANEDNAPSPSSTSRPTGSRARCRSGPSPRAWA